MCRGCASKGSSLKVKPKHTKVVKGIQMLEHTAIYLETFNFHSFIPSELSGGEAQDIHHIIRRGLCGNQANHILNLMALTRQEHEDYGDKKQYLSLLIRAHLAYCKKNGVDVGKLIKTLPECLGKIKNVYYGEE